MKFIEILWEVSFFDHKNGWFDGRIDSETVRAYFFQFNKNYQLSKMR